MANKGDEPQSAWLELAKLSQEMFKNRRELEWKLAFGFWTGIASFTAAFFVPDKIRPLTPPSCWKLASVYFGAWIAALLWQLAIQKGHADNLHYWKLYMESGAKSMEKAADGAAEPPEKNAGGKCPVCAANKDRDKFLDHWKPTNWLWLFAQCFFTGIFLCLSFLVIMSIGNHKQ
jgi:hypothetical protein